jgi:Protein of unknown function (DUF1045)
MSDLPEGFGPASRIALYYAPPQDCAWWRAGCEWLGRDPQSGEIFDHAASSSIAGVPYREVIAAPRRYGWHGTLVAPFHCASGVGPLDVLATAQSWARGITTPADIALRPALMGRFVALRAASEADEAILRDVAASALRALAACRTRASSEDVERRIVPGMSARQIALLREWDYPYVMDEFRFHMTVASSLDSPAAQEAVAAEWRTRIESLGPLPFNGAALFVEKEPGADFTLWKRLPFNSRQEPA